MVVWCSAGKQKQSGAARQRSAHLSHGFRLAETARGQWSARRISRASAASMARLIRRQACASAARRRLGRARPLPRGLLWCQLAAEILWKALATVFFFQSFFSSFLLCLPRFPIAFYKFTTARLCPWLFFFLMQNGCERASNGATALA